MGERLRERVRDLLAGPPAPALEAGVDAAVREILVAAEARAVVATG